MASAQGRRHPLRVQLLSVVEAVVERIRGVEGVPQIQPAPRREVVVGAERTPEQGSERRSAGKEEQEA